MTTNFRHRSLKTVIKQYLWRSQITSCIERHRSHRSLKFRHRLFDPWHFEIVIKCTRAPKAQPKPIFYDENKHHKHYNFHHKFNCHITISTWAKTNLLGGTDMAIMWCRHGAADMVDDVSAAQLWMGPIQSRLLWWAKYFSAHHLLPAMHGPYKNQST